MKSVLIILIGTVCFAGVRGHGVVTYGFKLHAQAGSASVFSMKYIPGELGFGLGTLKEGEGTFSVDFGHDSGIAKACYDEVIGDRDVCVQWFVNGKPTNSKIHIVPKDNPSNFGLYKVRVGQGNPNKKLSVCFSHDGHYLYGGNVGNNYPSNYIVKDEAPYITGEGDGNKQTKWVGWVAEKKWLTSTGRAIHVKPGSPLFVTQNNTDLCFVLKNEAPYSKDSNPEIEFDLCLTSNVKEAWMCQNPTGAKTPFPPDYEYILREPVWSTWVAYKKYINQSVVMDFAEKIKRNKLRLGVLEVDEKWETCFGSLKFDEKKFPDPKKMIHDIKEMGAKVTFWTMPFVNKECEEFIELKDHLFQTESGSTGTTSWWEGEAGMFNFLNDSAKKFFVNRLKDFKQKYGIDGFKFDAGEAYYIPNLFESRPLSDPNAFTTTYLKTVEGFGPNSEVRTGADSSSFQLLQRLQDTNSDWSLQNYGLKSVITSSLQLSILGFRTILPDMVGGNCYGPPPKKELFIRWVQLTTFLPVMQFSYHPWHFDQETVDITRQYIDLHFKYSDLFIDIHNDPKQPPLVAPVWWLDPELPEALKITDEFLVGDRILVAPVVEEGAISRSVFFPTGNWSDAYTEQIITGPVIVPNYPAPLGKLPYFLRKL